ncbi:MAG: hypothetical protein JST95_02565 [Bacteroidetes bacterium]|nr:hypothetical protein [Bacteroidota bacterium]
MKKLFTYLLLSGLYLLANAQNYGVPNPASTSDSGFTLLKSIPGDFQQVKVDVLDNIYLITSGNQLKKFNSNGDSLAVFNEVKKYGNPTYLDVSNPLKLLLYYKNFATVLILDRQLSQRNVINFRKQNIFSVNAIATSYDNQIWIFDEQDFKLKKISEEGAVLLESTDLRQLAGQAPSLQQIIDSDGLVYCYDPNHGFYIFDYYGALKNKLPFLHWEDIAIGRNVIAGFSENHLHRYALGSLTEKDYALPAISKERISITSINNKLYILRPTRLDIYLVK